MSSTSCTVAPPVLKPVEVFTNAAPAASAHLHARTIWSSSSRQHSRITFTGCPCAASTTAAMSLVQYSSSPLSSLPTFRTMSISVVPSSTACLASATFPAVLHAPSGKLMHVVMPTPEPFNRSAANAVHVPLMDTVLKWYSRASSHSFASCSCVAFCLSSVWSMY